jgi:tyrosine-protein kinase Etk/Wzc
LTKRLVVAEQGKQSGVISISYSDDSAEQVTDIVNSLEDAYLRQNVERRSANAQQSLEYLEKQLPQMKDQVDQAQTRLDSYQLSHGSVDVSQETQLVLKQSVDLESKRLELAQKREELVQRFTPQHPTVVALDQQIQSLNGAVERIRQQVEKLPNTCWTQFSN